MSSLTQTDFWIQEMERTLEESRRLFKEKKPKEANASLEQCRTAMMRLKREIKPEEMSETPGINEIITILLTRMETNLEKLIKTNTP